MDDRNVKHLEMIQGVVKRLAGNSFTIKGWSITLVSALFALAAKDANERYVVIALFPAFCFWGLDAYYLWKERLFRSLYDAVRTEADKPVDQRSVPPFSMNTGPVASRVDSWFGVLCSKTIVLLHVPIVAAVAAVYAYAIWK